ncbi:hypothetical protein [Alteribacillus bidgolensis]|uniref:Uncharacterized protein n=1 Tax=Alteribacillus bidgolensis TaxID=930129 RepID=A0A1G8R6I9_9BACI|nr:hypothetical protein [Alteribacillus bidgolensis]SDJ12579.1 hypothetical protein SAMN05216352_12512 [Alteribacillus bidgolensis]
METEIVDWVRNVVIIGSLLLLGSIWGTFLYVGVRHKQGRTVMRSITIIGLFLVWLFIIWIQESLYSSGSVVNIASLPFYAGYLVFPLTLVALWRIVYLHIGIYIHYLLTFPWYRIVVGSTTLVYGAFYLFASGMLTIADPNTSKVLEQGYIKVSQTYGPLSIWPSIEFWWPPLHLFGNISVAGLFLFASFVGLVGVALGFVIYQWRLKKKWDMKTMGSTMGSSVAVTATCFVSCSLPAIYPLLLVLFGSATADPLSRLLTNESGWLVNLVQMATLSLMAASVIYIGQRLKGMEKQTSNKCSSCNR